jgi:biopolymer transport protein ExbB
MLLVISLTALGVMLAKWVLILFSVLSVAIISERAITLRRVRVLEDDGYRLELERISGRITTLVPEQQRQAPCSLALHAGLQLPDTAIERRLEAVGQAIAVQSSRLQRPLSLLGTIASTAPYIGLLGTVLGILQAFHEIALSGKTGPSVVAGGISEALITTALGLGVAVPAVIAYNILSGRFNDLTLDIETHTLNLAARLPALNERLRTADNGPE